MRQCIVMDIATKSAELTEKRAQLLVAQRDRDPGRPTKENADEVGKLDAEHVLQRDRFEPDDPLVRGRVEPSRFCLGVIRIHAPTSCRAGTPTASRLCLPSSSTWTSPCELCATISSCMRLI